MLRTLRTPAALALFLVLAPGTLAQVTEILTPAGDGAGNLLEFPNASALDPAGNAYISGGGSHNVFRVSPAGVVEEILDPSGNGAGSVANPIAIELDGLGGAYVSSFLTDRVFHIDSAGTTTVVMDATGDGVNGLDGPYGLALDSAGNLYVCGGESNNVFMRTPAGVITQVLDSTGDGTSGLLYPVDVAVDPAGDLLVSGFMSNNVFRVTPSGAVTEIIDLGGAGGGQSLLRAGDLAIDSAGNVFVASFNTDLVFRITPSGDISVVLDVTGDGQGNTMVCPYSIDVDDDDDLYVAGFHSSNVFRVTPGGEITEVMDPSGDGTAALTLPLGLSAQGSGEFIVCGRDSDNVFHHQGDVAIGTNYCGPANSNSTGLPAALSAIGSESVVADNVRLVATDMPANQFGYFLTSQTQGFVTPPGSNGNLCLSGNIGRYVHDVMNSGAGGTFELQIEVNQMPVNPQVAIQPGETWNFQGWFRDSAVGSSNFTDGLSVTFH